MISWRERASSKRGAAREAHQRERHSSKRGTAEGATARGAATKGTTTREAQEQERQVHGERHGERYISKRRGSEQSKVCTARTQQRSKRHSSKRCGT